MKDSWLIARRFELARVTIEFQTPFVVGAGWGDDRVDSVCVTDANGLPAIPGTSLAGVLRHAMSQGDPDRCERCRAIFGFQQKNRGQASRLLLSWAQPHGADDRPVPFRGVKIDTDPVLRLLAAGVRRDHVRLDARGVVDGRGKFDELLVPAGARFTFEARLNLDHLPDDAPRLEAILSVLAARELRLGGRSRRGLGDFEVRRATYRQFDLADEADWVAFTRLPTALDAPLPEGLLRPWTLEPSTVEDTKTATLSLEPEDFFLFGGDPDLGRDGGNDRTQPPDMAAFREPRIVWNGDRGSVTDLPEPVLVASGIKGALRHRTSFHVRRLDRKLVDHRGQLDDESIADLDAQPDAEPNVVELFGTSKSSSEGDEEKTDDRPGRVLIEELRVANCKQGRLQHVSLDRFTSGPIDGALFDEEPLWGAGQRYELRVHVLGAASVSPMARAALAAALDDLARGRLAVGGGANRGHGYFQGTVGWSDGGAWVEGGGDS